MNDLAAAWAIYWPWIALASIAGSLIRLGIDRKGRVEFCQLFKDWWPTYLARRRAMYDWLRRKGLWRP